MIVNEILHIIQGALLQGNAEQSFSGVSFDSRTVGRGDLFVAVRGTVADGHHFISRALEKGASVIVCEETPGESLPGKACMIRVHDSARALGLIASKFYHEPSKDIKVIGITGTNGKTTVATLLYHLHKDLGYKAGLLSTIEVLIHGKSYAATHTTPDPVQIHDYLRKMADAGCEYCFMEVSSHAIAQERIAGIHFAGGIFTNLTHDHLDYHGEFKNYLLTKKAFFDQLPAVSFALANRDDRNGQVMLQNTIAKKYTYSLSGPSDFRAKIIEMHLDGSHLNIDGEDVWIRLPGRFNAINIMAVYACALLSGHSKHDALSALSGLSPVRGRFEILVGRDKIMAVVDYAHTPDALMNVLQTISELDRQGGRLITVIGAGGNRDRAKRPRMAQIAMNYSQLVVFTSDNPRDEDPEAIIDDMTEELGPDQQRNFIRISDRKEAIKSACKMAQPGDIILLAGKGHETYQEIKGERHPFDDLEIVKRHIL